MSENNRDHCPHAHEKRDIGHGDFCCVCRRLPEVNRLEDCIFGAL